MQQLQRLPPAARLLTRRERRPSAHVVQGVPQRQSPARGPRQARQAGVQRGPRAPRRP